jgi:hypothetical protein
VIATAQCACTRTRMCSPTTLYSDDTLQALQRKQARHSPVTFAHSRFMCNMFLHYVSRVLLSSTYIWCFLLPLRGVWLCEIDMLVRA